jgi:hypothetical protein
MIENLSYREWKRTHTQPKDLQNLLSLTLKHEIVFTQRLALCKEYSPTFHLVLPAKKSLLKHCQIKDRDSIIIKFLKEKLSKKLNKYFKTIETHFATTMRVNH